MVKVYFQSSFLWGKLSLLSLGFFFTEVASAKKDAFYLDYPHCRIRLSQSTKSLKKSYIDVLKKKLKYRKFTVREMPESARIGIDELYLQLEKMMVGRGLVKSCQMKLTFFITKSDYVRPQVDKKLFIKAIRRQFPRYSIEGHERCEQAIKDLFIHVPPCGEGKEKRNKKRPDLKKFLLNPEASSRNKNSISQR